MSQENVELSLRLNDAWNEGRMESDAGRAGEHETAL